MNRSLFAFLICILPFATVRAQFYYKDIVSSGQLTADMKSYKEKKVHHIKVKSFEDSGEPSEGFFCEKKISRDFKTADLFTRSGMGGKSLFTSNFNDKGQIQSSTDSSDISVSHNYYYYDNQGRINKITSTVRSSDDDFNTEIVEEHIYSYGANDLPSGMLRVKQHSDTTRILFSLDDKNNLSIEKDTRDGSKYYYYYDAKNQLTDVVHANEFREKLVAVYVFEYNNSGGITQMTTTEEGTNNFYTWRYDYEDGLRKRERLFSKDRKLMGTIEYEYQ